MLSPSTDCLIIEAVSLAIVGLITVPSLLSLYHRIKNTSNGYQPVDGLYEDEDGKATPASQKSFSTLVPRAISLIATAIGFLASLSCVIIATAGVASGAVVENWLRFGTFVLLTVQSLVICVLERDTTRQFHLSVYACITCAIILAGLIGGNTAIRDYEYADAPVVVLMAIETVSSALGILTFGLIDRRPQVFRDGRRVDAEFTVSIWSKLSFTWAAPVLAFARRNKKLDLKDLPMLPKYVRTETLSLNFGHARKFDRLWKTLIWAFRWVFFLQIGLSTTAAVLQFVPQLCMYMILKLLEQRSSGSYPAGIAWAWVFGLGLAMLAISFVESWMYFMIFGELGIPIRNTLSTLVFEKSLRRKDVKSAGKTASTMIIHAAPMSSTATNEATTPHEQNNTTSIAENNKEVEDVETEEKTRQGVVNMIGVDAKRVADWLTFSYFFWTAPIKLLISLSFLYTMIGGWPLLAGLAAFSLTIPVNIWLSKIYTTLQGDLMSFRDEKLRIVTECLQGIRQIKFTATEDRWEKRIKDAREKELRTLRLVFSYDTGLIFLWIWSPVMLSAASLSVYALIHGGLTPSIAFTTIAVLSQIEVTLSILPELFSDSLESIVSLSRIEKYLNAPERVPHSDPSDDQIEFVAASIAWPSDAEDDEPDRFVLRDISISFPPHELSVISGKTGSGKSLLLAAILGEIDKVSGMIRRPVPPTPSERFDSTATRGNWILPTAVAFVAQIPWIENASVQDNILFGLPLDKGRYSKTVKVCALEPDLELLPDGDQTEVGGSGINISGGQRWRIAFARALYSRAGILVLDDIFSAVDANVGRQLFEEALTGELGTGRTRILATHHVHLCLPRTKYTVLVGEDGTISHAGLVEDLKRTGSLDEILKVEENHNASNQKVEDVDENKKGDDDTLTLKKILSHRSAVSAQVDNSGVDTKGKLQPRKFVEDEKRETGAIKMEVYKDYFKESGALYYWIPLLLCFSSSSFLDIARSWWVKLWTGNSQTEAQVTYFSHRILLQTPMSNINASFDTAESQSTGDLGYWLGVYLGLSFALVCIGTAKYGCMYATSLKASRKMFERLCFTVLRTRLRWLDQTPVGRILNRFTADFNTLDSRIAPDMAYFMYQGLELLVITLVGLLVSYFMVPFVVVLSAIAGFIAMRYLNGAREVKRLESNAKSPIFEQFGSTLTGLATIRAFGKGEDFVNRMWSKIDDHGSSAWHLWLFNRWLSTRLNFVGAAFAVIVAMIIVSIRGIDAAIAGFVLTFALQYTSAITWTLRNYANLEMDMNATERISEYSKLDIEDQSGADPPAAWPTQGRLEVSNLVAGYAPELSPVLKGLTFTVEKGQRVGVVGRTGAGKSSLTLALFRILNVREGSVSVDGIDLSSIKLKHVRSRLAIIPQDPVLFSGDVRSNLDPFHQYPDSDLHDALERVHLTNSSGTATPGAPTNTSPFRSLSSKISEGGLNLSQGQRQLLCLARAIISRPKLLVLDEATSAVDMATDALIQRSIREQFTDSTLLVIAHRLSTIADFDKILVMSEGRAVEYGAPKDLLKKEGGGVFKELVDSSGEKESLVSVIMGEEK